MPSPIQITLAQPSDAGLIADIARRTFYETFAPYNSAENMRLFQDQQLTRERQMAELGAPGRTFLLAYLGDEPVGYASMREGGLQTGEEGLRADGAGSPPEMAGTNAIEICQIYSEQRTIGKGVGKALMEACLGIARERGKEWIWLGVWEHNQRAIAFYTKWGFERCGEHIFMVGHDAQTDWWMKKRL
jgi:ribosomal protein S18 acetylase RimI-like enzyme